MSAKNGSEIIKTGERAQVLLPLVFRGGFDYRVPLHMEVSAGDWVQVPFGKKSLWGVVWGRGESAVEEKKIKDIARLSAHLPPMSDAMRTFLGWVSWYTLAPLGMVLKMTLSAPDALEPPVQEARYLLPAPLRMRGQEYEPAMSARSAVSSRGQQAERETSYIKLTPARQRIIAYLCDGRAQSAKEIGLHAKVSPAVLRGFIKAGGLEAAAASQVGSHKDEARPPLIASPPPLSPDQHSAAATLRAKLAGGFSVTVLDGVTGSGKTEVYFDTIAACLEHRKQALVLLPEIALSVQWLARFRKRFGFAPDVWHSGVTAARRREIWRALATGESRVVVGARSALFLPFLRLGLIIVDEEHDSSYKQEDGVIYQARDMAVARASHEKIPAVLVSATPSLETEHNIERQRYTRVHLPARHGGALMPQIQLLDMRRESLATGSWLCEPLRQALLATFAARRQSMLFMNRRGYAPLMLCRACGHRFQCPHCTSWLVLHRARARLLCHHCGYTAAVPRQCPECKHENSLTPYGPGVERVAEEARALLPDARIEVMTSDHIDTPEKADHLIHAMMNGEVDVLVGTQMIAKGHHFAGLALVGVVDADMGLAGGDLRASERTYQLLHQLSGRSGREETLGRVMLQTYLPEHPVMAALAAGDRDRFMWLEGRLREEAAMPPYGKLVSVIVEGRNEPEVAAFARELVRKAGDQGLRETGEEGGMREKSSDHPIHPITRLPGLLTPAPLILGPAPAPISLLRGKYRYRILIKAGRNFPLQPYLTGWLLPHKTPSSVRVKIDVDPYSFI